MSGERRNTADNLNTSKKIVHFIMPAFMEPFSQDGRVHDMCKLESEITGCRGFRESPRLTRTSIAKAAVCLLVEKAFLHLFKQLQVLLQLDGGPLPGVFL